MARKVGGFKYKVNNKMRGAFGMTDFAKKTITINKKRHKNKKALKTFPKKDRSLLNTIEHERMHAKHPRMTERQVRKKTRTHVARMSPKAKRRAYKLFSYPKRRK